MGQLDGMVYVSIFFYFWVQLTGKNTLTTWRGRAHEKAVTLGSPHRAQQKVCKNRGDMEMAWQGGPCPTQCLNPALGPALSVRLSHQTQPWDQVRSVPPSALWWR